MTKQTTLTIQENRGAARLWIQGSILTDNGWTKGKQWVMTAKDGVVTLKAAKGDEPKLRKVAGNEKRPVIDTKDPRIGEAFPVGTRVVVDVTKNAITIREE
tara:strand:- start:3566 stop:3868 length:303 start_codon:yes stop_codon:yes gene_type:complete